MIMNNSLKGFYFSIATMLFWGMSVVSSRYAVVNLEMHPYLLATIRIFIASMVLLLIAGKGSKVSESVKNPYTWIYSSLQIFLNVFTATALIYVSSTEATLLQRFNIILGLIFGYIFLRRQTSKTDVLGCVFILLGMLSLLVSFELKQAISVMLAVLGASSCHVLRTIVVEKHPVAKGAKTFKEYCRVLSYILLVTSVTFLCFAFIVGGIVNLIPFLQKFDFLPALQETFTRSQLLFATFTGVCFVTPSMYCFFTAAQLVGSANFLIYVAYLPVVTFIVEYIVSYFGFIPAPHLTFLEILSGVLIMGGAFFMTFFRNKKKETVVEFAKKIKTEEKKQEEISFSNTYSIQYILTIILGVLIYGFLWSIAK